jgi:hypothetical protein
LTLSKNPAHYEHVQRILDAALPHEKVIFKCENSRAAVRWRQEAYFYRSICGHDKYAILMLQLDGANVIISKRKIEGTLVLPDGSIVKPGDSYIESEAELAAKSLATRLGLDVDD